MYAACGTCSGLSGAYTAYGARRGVAGVLDWLGQALHTAVSLAAHVGPLQTQGQHQRQGNGALQASPLPFTDM